MLDLLNPDPYFLFMREIVIAVGSGTLTVPELKHIRKLWLAGEKDPGRIVALYRDGNLKPTEE